MKRDPGALDVMARQRIEMPYLATGHSRDPFPIVRENSPATIIRIFNTLARQYRRETRFDFAPEILVSKHCGRRYEQGGLLMPSRRTLIADARLIAGVIGLHRDSRSEIWVLAWLYLHPYERGQGLIEFAWSSAVDEFGPIAVRRDPYNTPAGARLVERLQNGNTGSRPRNHKAERSL
jgi:hypothetical protein